MGIQSASFKRQVLWAMPGQGLGGYGTFLKSRFKTPLGKRDLKAGPTISLVSALTIRLLGWKVGEPFFSQLGMFFSVTTFWGSYMNTLASLFCNTAYVTRLDPSKWTEKVRAAMQVEIDSEMAQGYVSRYSGIEKCNWIWHLISEGVIF